MHTYKSTALPPPEVVELLTKFEFSEQYIDGWFAVPTLYPQTRKLNQSKIIEIDAVKTLSPFLGKKVLTCSLRTLDVFNGCGHQCDSCLADATLPSRMFSLESLQHLFQNKKFIRMLQPDSLRFGSSGDILDHPDAIRIINLALWYTRSLDNIQKRQSSGKSRHVISIFTNYRPNLEEKILELIDIARRHRKRFRLVLSLPVNRKGTLNLLFTKFAEAHAGIFTINDYHPDGTASVSCTLTNVNIQDVLHKTVLHLSGRVLDQKYLDQKAEPFLSHPANRELDFCQRGLVKTYLNPDALWLMVYATMYESHTTRIFTPINRYNVSFLRYCQWHPDFFTPPNWPGGKGSKKSFAEIRETQSALISAKVKIRPVTIVK